MIQSSILIVLIAINAFFAATEMALISLNDNKIKVMADDGDKKAKQLLDILSRPTEFLSTIQIGITLTGFMASAFASVSYSDSIVNFLVAYVDLPIEILSTFTMIIITLILSYLSLVLGELVPKRIAMQHAEEIAFGVVWVLKLIAFLTLPFVHLLTFSTNTLLRLIGINPDDQPEEVTEEEIRMMVDVGEEKGTIRETEKEMINNIFEFDNTEVSEIMTHRTDVEGIEVGASLDEVKKIVLEQQYTRFPIYEDDIDHIVGMIHLKDLWMFLDQCENKDFNLSSIMRKPYFVPESKRLNELLVELQKNKTHFAVVIDEYGGTAGIITIEDLIEEILGEISDEYDEDERLVVQVSPYTYDALGSVELDMLEESAELGLPLEDIEDYDTLSGLLVAQWGRIPEDNETIDLVYHDIHFKVLKVQDKVITKVRIIKPEKKEDEA